MLKKIHPLALASLMGVGAFALPAASATAATLPAVQQSATNDLTLGEGDLLQDVAQRKKVDRKKVVRKKVVYNRGRHGARYRKRNGRYIHYYNGYYYASPWWLLAVPLIY